jgi:hypothetical protein
MEKWHSVTLIIITLVVFSAGIFYDQIKKNTLTGYDEAIAIKSTISTGSEEPKLQLEQKPLVSSENSSAWAETSKVLEVSSENFLLTSLHKEALSGETFINILLDELNKNQTLSEIIFSPFQEISFKQADILKSLFNTHLNDNKRKQVFLNVRGHSRKASGFLAQLIIKTYEKALKQEDPSNPILPSLIEQKSKIDTLHEEQFKLSKNIPDDQGFDQEISIEEIAIKSELSQVSAEIESLILILREIEDIHRKKKDMSSYLSIHFLANFGRVEEISTRISQLQDMIINKSPEPIIKIEITKNLEALNESLNQELAVGIDDIKKSFQNNLAKQKELNARLVDLKFKEQKDTFLSPKMKLLKAHNKLLLTVKKEYENLQMNWEQAKENFIFRK